MKTLNLLFSLFIFSNIFSQVDTLYYTEHQLKLTPPINDRFSLESNTFFIDTLINDTIKYFFTEKKCRFTIDTFFETLEIIEEGKEPYMLSMTLEFEKTYTETLESDKMIDGQLYHQIYHTSWYYFKLENGNTLVYCMIGDLPNSLFIYVGNKLNGYYYLDENNLAKIHYDNIHEDKSNRKKKNP